MGPGLTAPDKIVMQRRPATQIRLPPESAVVYLRSNSQKAAKAAAFSTSAAAPSYFKFSSAKFPVSQKVQPRFYPCAASFGYRMRVRQHQEVGTTVQLRALNAYGAIVIARNQRVHAACTATPPAMIPNSQQGMPAPAQPRFSPWRSCCPAGPK